MRADSAFYTGRIVAAIREAGARFSITAQHNTSVTAAIATIDKQAWHQITYPRAIHDPDTDQWHSAAEIAETSYTAFTHVTDNPGRAATERLVVRRIHIGTD